MAELPTPPSLLDEVNPRLVVAVTRSQKRKREVERALVTERKASGASAEALETSARATSSKGTGSSVKVHQSPPHRPDSKDGHLQYELGESITPVYKILAPLGEGTFGRVLECWDRKSRSYCAVKIIRNVQKYRDAAMIEIDVLKTVQKSGTGSLAAIAR